MNSVCYIIGAGDARGAVISQRPGSLVIAADGGLSALLTLGVRPELVVGDFDSLGSVPNGYEIVRHPAEKDDTDMLLAVNEGLKRGYRVFSLLGGVGGRLDHTLANIQVLSYLSERGAIGFLCGAGAVMTAVTDGTLIIPAGRRGFISVFCSGQDAGGVFLRGLKYTLTDARLTHDVPLGVSNEFTGSPAEIEVRRGTLTVLWYEDGFDPASGGIIFIRRKP